MEIILDYAVQIGAFIVLGIVGLVIYGILAANDVKTWVKTVVFLFAGESVAAIFGWISWRAYGTGNTTGAVAGVCTTVFYAAIVIGVAAANHKTKWKNID